MPSHETPVHHLPRQIEKLIAALAVYFGQRNKTLLHKLLVNSRYRVIEGTDYDNWDGGTWGHTIYFQVPPSIYYGMFDELGEVAREIGEGLNKLAKCDNEHIATVNLEIDDDPSLENWREKSGLLLRGSPLKTAASDTDLHRLWESGFIRLFLSHKSQYKRQTSDLKKHLLKFGITSFVAHEDIEPTKTWQDEIEKALFSMHVLVPLLTDQFHDSHWTDQEIGVAIGRGVPVIPVRLGTDPYGFIGKYQAIPGLEKLPSVLAAELAAIIFTHPAIADLTAGALVTRFETADSYERANSTMAHLERYVTHATPDLIERLENAGAKNSQVRNAFEVKAKLPRLLARLKQEH